MGYFNFLYKITRIIDMLTRKRNRRAIMVILIIIAVIFILHNKGYCAQEDALYTTDTTEFILSEYDSLCDYLLYKFYATQNNSSAQTRFDEMFSYIENGYYPYITSQVRSDNVRMYFIWFYRTSYNMTLFDTSLVYNDNMRVPSTGYNITIPSGSNRYQINTETNQVAYWTTTSDLNIAVPQILLYKLPSQFIEMMQFKGRISGNNNELLNQVINIKNEIQDTNEKLDDLNDNITDTTYNENVVSVDTSTIDNVSDTEITGLFTGVIGSFSNALNTYGGTITKIIPLPHGGQIEIPSNIVSSHLGNLTALVEAFWYFVFGIYLFRFVSNLIHKIKTGDILNGYTNDNEIITSSML